MSLAGALQKYEEARQFAGGYEQLATDAPDLTVPYVYFALQLQPEMTTSTLGAGYSDQLSALERLAAIIYQRLARRSSRRRTRSRPRVSAARRSSVGSRSRSSLSCSKTVNTYALLEGCRFASTVTGTVGWEAITGGKPALVFGQPWFARLPGVVAFPAGPDRRRGAATIDHAALERALSALLRKTARGVIDPVYQGIVEGLRRVGQCRAIARLPGARHRGAAVRRRSDGAVGVRRTAVFFVASPLHYLAARRVALDHEPDARHVLVYYNRVLEPVVRPGD